MRKTFLALTALCVVLSGRAQEVLRKLDWAELSKSGKALSGVVENGFLRVESTNATGLRADLLKIENPGISRSFYAVRGEIRSDNVEGDGFLEMWSVFPAAQAGAGEGKFFSRTLGESGETGKISGTSQLRTFMLPFNRTGAATPPSRLELNLILPGKGVVYVGPLELVEFAARSADPAIAGAWWSDRTAGWIGGIGGSLLGCLGALIGCLAAQRKARGFVIGTASAMIGLGAILAFATVIALMMRQPYSVWYPLALGAVLLLSIIPVRLRGFRRQYEDHELRRMAAADAAGR
jgi:hypothetical protein